MNRSVSATEKSSVICNGRRQKVDTHLLRPRRDSERISVRICKNIFCENAYCVFSEAAQVPSFTPKKWVERSFGLSTRFMSLRASVTSVAISCVIVEIASIARQASRFAMTMRFLTLLIFKGLFLFAKNQKNTLPTHIVKVG